jgi:hypothetical protein
VAASPASMTPVSRTSTPSTGSKTSVKKKQQKSWWRYLSKGKLAFSLSPRAQSYQQNFSDLSNFL